MLLFYHHGLFGVIFALFDRALTRTKKKAEYCALNYLLHACEMLRAHVKFNELCPLQITPQRADKLNRNLFVVPSLSAA